MKVYIPATILGALEMGEPSQTAQYILSIPLKKVGKGRSAIADLTEPQIKELTEDIRNIKDLAEPWAFGMDADAIGKAEYYASEKWLKKYAIQPKEQS